MGEIADALRRARKETGSPEATAKARQAARADAESRENVYSRASEVAQERAEAEPPPTEETPTAAPSTPRVDADEKPYDVAIPRDRRGNWAARAVVADGDGASSEAYRHFAIRVSRELERRRTKSVMVLSAVRHEGKTTTACNLALAYASMAGGRNTALLDLDLRRPSVTTALGIQPRIGLEALLSGQADLDDVRLRTDLPSLDVYPTAYPLLEPHRELTHPRVAGIFAELERRYDTIVIDTAPLLLVPDSELLFAHVGAAVAVMRSRRTRRDAFRELIGTIPDGKLLGTFVNESRPSRHSKQYGYYGKDREKDAAARNATRAEA